MRDQQKMEVLLKGKNTKKEMSNAKKGMRWETGYVLPSGTAPPPPSHDHHRAPHPHSLPCLTDASHPTPRERTRCG